MRMRQTRSLTAIAGLIILLGVIGPAAAMAPEGDPYSLEPAVGQPIYETLERLGYLPNPDPARLGVGIAAYLWRNRDRLQDLNIPQQREPDLVICLLADENPKLAVLAAQEPLASWCPERLVQP